jgi:hypothetical protein
VLTLLVHDQWPRIQPIVRRYPFWTLAAIGLAVTMAIGVIWLSGLLVKMEEAPLWAMGRAHRLQYYLIEFGRILPLLWPVLPLAAAVAIAEPAQRRLALYCLVVVISALVVHSIAAPKAIRYVYYFMPLFCVLWACAVAAVLTQADRHVRHDGAANRLEPLAVIVLMGLGIAVSQEGVRTINLAAGRLSAVTELPFADEPDWRLALAELLPMARRANRVVTSNSVKALYYLGRYDFELNATIVPETRSRQEFGVDVRTGRRAISRPESIERVLDESGDTMVVIETKKIGRTSGVTAEAIAVVESRCEEIPLSAEAGVRAWACNAAR